MPTTSYNMAYTLRSYALAFRDIAPSNRNVIYTGTLYAINIVLYKHLYLRTKTLNS